MASKRNFLAVPAKSAYDVDIASRVNSYITTCLVLTPETQNAVKESLDELNRLRRNAFLHEECGKSVSSIDNMNRYYDSFASLTEKIQIKDSDCPIPFRWKIAFAEKGLFAGGKRDLTLNYSGYEKACVLFNIAAYQSKYASTLDLTNDEEMRIAVQYYQKSANIFELLKNDIMHFLQDEVPRDMQPQLLNALAQLMITQANEVMYVKAVKGGSSPSILSSLAMHLAESYENIYKSLSYEQARGIVDKSWYATIQGKHFAYQGHGTKHHFDHLENGGLDAIPERLARAKESLELFEKAEQTHPHAYTAEVQAAKVTWQKIEKDNNLIYHSRIPNKSELGPIPSKSILSLSAVKFPLFKDFKDIFIQLVSVHVSKAATLFQGKLKERVFALVNELKESDKNVRAGLASINMPALIEDELKQERIPASIAAKADDIRSKGGYHLIEQQEKQLGIASNEANAMISKIRATLEAEERSDAALRENYGARWTTMSSGSLTEKFKQEIGKYSGILRNANEADEKIKAKIRLCERDVSIMSGPRENLVERIPPITATATHKSQAIDKLRELWTVMNREMQQVDPLEKRLNEIKYDPTSEFLAILKSDGKLDDEQAISFAASKIESLMGPIAKEVADNNSLRQNVLEEMRVWHQQIHSGSSTDEGRTKALQQLAAAYDAFLECTSNINEGTKFYNDLKTLLVRLQQQIDDFVFARQTEKEDIITVLEPGKNPNDLIKSLVDKSQPNRAVPPPRPAPPALNTNTTNRAPDLSQLNIGASQPATAPSVPTQPSAAPTIPQHQSHYQPNTAQNYNWYQPGQQAPPQQFQNYQYPPQQPFYQQMPNLPYYGAAYHQSGPGVPQNPYMTPYPMQGPYGHPQPQFGNQPPQQPPTSNNPNNPFAQ
ncbi:BRO1 domain-containing protein [Aphelenchoides bicaudatus]|nr:BRO1 domain-containing protein [Aphelenchoides bicaudatus]